MGDVDYIGFKNGAEFTGLERTRDKYGFWTTTYDYDCPAPNLVDFLAKYNGDLNITGINVGRGPTHQVKLTVPDAFDGKPPDPKQKAQNEVWEMMTNSEMKSVRTHPYFWPETAGDDYNKVLNDIDEYIQKDGTATAREQFEMICENYNVGGDEKTRADEYLQMRELKIDEYPQAVFVLRRTMLKASADDEKEALDGINQVDETVDLSKATFDWPQQIHPDSMELEDVEWLKCDPKITKSAAAGRYLIEQYWKGGFWSSILYGGSLTP
jgi:hypothetical protein